jgi:hypothetical protein
MMAPCPDCGARTEIPEGTAETSKIRCGTCYRWIQAVPIAPLIPPNVLARMQALEQENAELRAKLGL